MIKKLSLLTLCTLTAYVHTRAMDISAHRLSLFGTTANTLFCSSHPQDMQWWKRW